MDMPASDVDAGGPVAMSKDSQITSPSLKRGGGTNRAESLVASRAFVRTPSSPSTDDSLSLILEKQ